MSRIVDIEQLGCLIWKDGEHGTTFDDGVLWVLEKIDKLPAIEPQQTCEYWDSESKFCALCRPSAQPQSKIIRCKDCKYRYIDEKFGPSCELDTGDPYETGRNADEDDWFCADAERRTE